MGLYLWNNGSSPPVMQRNDFGFSTQGIFDSLGWHSDTEKYFKELPRFWDHGIAGSFLQVLRILKEKFSDLGNEKDPFESAIIVSSENSSDFEDFLDEIANLGISRQYAGGVAAYSAGEPKGNLYPFGSEVLVLLGSQPASTTNLHTTIVSPTIFLEIQFPRTLVSIDEQPSVAYYDASRSQKSILDYEHLTISDIQGRNVHLSLGSDGTLHSGARLPDKQGVLRFVPNIAIGLESLVKKGGLICACAGLRGAMERSFALDMDNGISFVMVFLYGEVVTTREFRPELGNLMVSRLSL